MEKEKLVTDNLEKNISSESNTQSDDTNELDDSGNTIDPVENSQPEELSELDKLINERTGYWPIKLDEQDLKWIKSACNSKFKHTGPNEAYMLINCFVGISSAIKRLESAKEGDPIILPASTVEACSFFINQYSGVGIESAQRNFRIAMALNPIIIEMQKLDAEIEKLKTETSSKNK